MNTIKYSIAIILSLLALNASALTRAEYQFTDGKEVVFFSTVAENPNIEKIQKALNKDDLKEFENLSAEAVNDVWCRIETHTESPILRLECYQPHGGYGFSVHDDYDPSIKGYGNLTNTLFNLRGDLRAIIDK